jgi:hypothetical protein
MSVFRKSREKIQDDIIRRMSEPDDLRALRNQKEQIEADMAGALKRQLDAAKAERLRREIRELGHKPVA